MTREVKLLEYLPPFLKDYRELASALTAEDPEFALQWEELNRAFLNRFILSADEYGISRYESMMGIEPEEDDSLEDRRIRVYSRWNERLPYTVRRLRETLAGLLGESGFRMDTGALSEYLLGLILVNQTDRTVGLVEEMLKRWLPLNMVLFLQSFLVVRQEAGLRIGAGCCEYIRIRASPDMQETVFRRTAALETGLGAAAYYKADYRPANTA